MGAFISIILCSVLECEGPPLGGAITNEPTSSPVISTGGTQLVDMESIVFADIDVETLNSNVNFVRTVFELDTNTAMTAAVPDGVQLYFDIIKDVEEGNGPFDYTYRTELRETNNDGYYPFTGTTAVYHYHFLVNQMDDLCGPLTVFQRFNRDIDGPDIELELTGKFQFSDAIANELQVVHEFDSGERIRLDGKFLQPMNDLNVAVYSAEEGAYKVSLNGNTLSERSGLDTRPSTRGRWTQFGLYPHGLLDTSNRNAQVASGSGTFSITQVFYTKSTHDGELDLSTITTVDLK